MFESLTQEALEAIRSTMILIFWVGFALGGIVGATVGSILTVIDIIKKQP